MDLISIRSFMTELTKLALEDADIQALKADRQGKEYLKGGLLPNNHPANTNFVPKIAMDATPIYNAALDMPANKKEPGAYQKARDWGLRGVQGGFAGAGVNTLLHNMSGKIMSPHQYRKGALIGAGLAIADRAYRYRDDLTKSAMVGSSSFTPARALMSSKSTGNLMNKVHMGEKPRTAGLIGRVGRLPTE